MKFGRSRACWPTVTTLGYGRIRKEHLTLWWLGRMGRVDFRKVRFPEIFGFLCPDKILFRDEFERCRVSHRLSPKLNGLRSLNLPCTESTSFHQQVQLTIATSTLVVSAVFM